MEKYIYDNSNGLWYELHGDYYLPCLVIPEEEIHTIGIWGKKHQQYLRDHRSMVYTDLVLSGKLHSYLADIDTQARNSWQEQTLAYYAGASVECVEPEELDEDERLARRRAYLEKEFGSVE